MKIQRKVDCNTIPTISVLIITDNIPKWVNVVQNAINVLRCNKADNGSTYHLENPMFYIDIESNTKDYKKRRRYSHIIVDKVINDDFEKCVLRPLISNPVRYTENGKKILSVDEEDKEAPDMEKRTIL